MGRLLIFFSFLIIFNLFDTNFNCEALFHQNNKISCICQTWQCLFVLFLRGLEVLNLEALFTIYLSSHNNIFYFLFSMHICDSSTTNFFSLRSEKEKNILKKDNIKQRTEVERKEKLKRVLSIISGVH